MNAEILMFLGGAGAFGITFWWVRSRQLREKYAVMWMTVAGALLLMGIFPDVIKSLAQATRMAYPSMVLFLALGAIYVFSMSVSLSLTRSRRVAVRLTQELALARYELGRLQQRLSEMEPHSRDDDRREPSPV